MAYPTQLFLPKSTGIMPLILCECALHRSRQKHPNWISLINVTFKFTSAQRPWQIFTNFFAVTLLHVLIPCSKNCFLVSLLDFLRISSTISHMKVLITNQINRSTPESLLFFPTIQPTFHIFLQLKILHQKDGHRTVKSSCRPRTTDNQEAGPKAF